MALILQVRTGGWKCGVTYTPRGEVLAPAQRDGGVFRLTLSLFIINSLLNQGIYCYLVVTGVEKKKKKVYSFVPLLSPLPSSSTVHPPEPLPPGRRTRKKYNWKKEKKEKEKKIKCEFNKDAKTIPPNKKKRSQTKPNQTNK